MDKGSPWVKNRDVIFFTPFPTIVNKPGVYVTRCGETVLVTEVGRSIKCRDCEGVYNNGIKESWNSTGRLYTGLLSQNDIVSFSE